MVGRKHSKVRLTGLAAGSAVGDIYYPFLSLGSRKNHGASKELEICHVDIGLKRKVGGQPRFRGMGP